jgi:hypothetical protein
MRRFACSLLIVFLSGLAHAEALSQGAKVEMPLGSLKPSQMMVGRAEVDANFQHWQRKAAVHGMTLGEYADEKLVPKFRHMKLAAIIDPQGNVRPTDGHHRISALLEVARQTGVSVPVQVKIAKDYRGDSMEHYANDFVVRRGKGAFTRGVMRLDPLERVEHLPGSFATLKNSPMRSSMAHLFTKLRLDGVKLVDYAEFKVGDWLVDHGLFGALEKEGLVKPHTTALPNELVGDPRVLAVMQRELETKDGVHFLAGLANGHLHQIEKRLADARR